MGVGSEDAVVIRAAEKDGETSKITVNCPDKTGLGCDFSWIILDFGLRITKAGEYLLFSPVIVLLIFIFFYTILLRLALVFFSLNLTFHCQSLLSSSS